MVVGSVCGGGGRTMVITWDYPRKNGTRGLPIYEAQN